MQDVSKGEGRTVLFVSHNMGSMQRLCTSGILLENGSIKYMGSITNTIRTYQSDEIVQDSFEGIDGDPNILYLRKASVSSNDGNIFYNSSTIKIEFEVNVIKQIPSLVIGFNIYSIYQYPLARADYNDESQQPSLKSGIYKFTFEIPPFTFAEGEYIIKFDIAERYIKCHTTEKSYLSFTIIQNETCFGNAFSESIPTKNSLIRSKWLNSISTCNY